MVACVCGPAGGGCRNAVGREHARVPALDLLLASTSRYRAALLSRLGLPFRCLAPACDEEALKRPELTPQALSEMLALAKADSLMATNPAATIIGGDQVAALEEEGGWRILGKPGTAPAALEQLARLAGRTHLLFTAIAVLHRGTVLRHTDVTSLRMRDLARDQLARYVEADQPLDCAGAYKLEARGIALFERIDSGDHSAITGLPLIALTGMLSSLGYAVP
jgi:septum formation protein